MRLFSFSKTHTDKNLESEERNKLVEELLNRSVVEILPSKEKLKEILLSDKKLNIYIGADATGSSLHIGHATNYIILEKFRKLGHNVFILIGDFTARIGDPTDKLAARVPLTREQVVENTKDWIRQLRPIIDIDNKENKVNIVYNHDWLSKLNFEDIIDLSSNFTVQQMMERDMFEKRFKENKPVFLHEFFYPLMQGYDSVALDIDIEICGNDQKFNALTGRTLVKRYKNKEKFVYITTLLENPITKEKMMSKSLGTGVFLNMSPDEMFEKIMMQPDENIPQLYIDCTYKSIEDIDKVKINLLDTNINPRDIKMDLAEEIVSVYHGKEEAENAKVNFINLYQKNIIPTDIKNLYLNEEKNIVDILVNSKLSLSKTQARKDLEQGTIKVDQKSIDINFDIHFKNEYVVQKGKKDFVKVFHNR
jgi:tyrosyl-tRNA synthetase